MAKFRLVTAAAGVALAAGGLFAQPAVAAHVAVFGQNGLGAYYADLGNTVDYVSDQQLSTPGFLKSYDTFVYTRNGSNFGDGLSVAAGRQVSRFAAGGKFVLFNNDAADGVGYEPTLQTAFSNALNYVSTSGHGFIGEYVGAFSAYTANSDGHTALGLLPGTAGPNGGGQGGSDGSINLAPAGVNSPVLAGVTLPYNPSSVEFGSTITGTPDHYVLARFDNGNPAILAGTSGAVPEPASWALMIAGFGLVGALSRRRAGTMAAA